MPKLTIDEACPDDFWNFTNETVDVTEQSYKDGILSLKDFIRNKYMHWLMDKRES